jgi:hypothetical protein
MFKELKAGGSKKGYCVLTDGKGGQRLTQPSWSQITNVHSANAGAEADDSDDASEKVESDGEETEEEKKEDKEDDKEEKEAEKEEEVKEAEEDAVEEEKEKEEDKKDEEIRAGRAAAKRGGIGRRRN